MRTGSDQELLAAIQAGDGDQALEILLERHGALVLGTCRRITGHHHDAEEAAQAVFLVLYEKARAALVVSSLPAWLHRVACFIAVRLRDARRRRARREAPWPPAQQDVPAPEAPPAGDLALRIDAALDRLPRHYRLPLLLHYLENCSFDEIALRMDLRCETVAVRVSRARSMLRRQLQVTERILEVAGLASLTTSPGRGLAWRGVNQHPAPEVRTLVRRYLVSHQHAFVAKLAIAAAAVLLVGSLTLAYTVRHQGRGVVTTARDTAAPASEKPLAAPTRVPAAAQAAAQPAAALAYPRASLPVPLWQERLIAELSRPVTLHCGQQPVWHLIDAIGSQTGILMLAAAPLQRFQALVTPIASEHETVQAVLDRIAADTGLDYRIYAGGLLWQGAGSPRQWRAVVTGVEPVLPLAQRYYRLADLPPGRDVQEWLYTLQTHTDLHWESAEYGAEEFQGMVIVTHRADAEAALDAVLLPTAIPGPASPASMPPDPLPALSAAELALQQALNHSIVQLPSAEAPLGVVLDALTKASGLELQFQEELPELQEPLPPRPLQLRAAGLPLRFALCQVLEGTGLQATARLVGTDGALRPALLVGHAVTPQFASHRYHLMPAMGAGNTWIDGPAVVEWLKKNVDISAWDDHRVHVTADESTFLVTQSLEVLQDLDEQVPRIQALWSGVRPPPRVPLLPSVTLAVATQDQASRPGGSSGQSREF